MFKFLINRRMKKGQSTLEYAILIIVVMAALLSIQVYVKRGIQGRFKSAADDIGDQYSPGNTNVLKIMRTRSETEESNIKGSQSSRLLEDEVTDDLMNSSVMDQTMEFWGN